MAGKLTGWTALWSNESSSTFWNTSHALGVGYDAYVDNKKARSRAESVTDQRTLMIF